MTQPGFRKGRPGGTRGGAGGGATGADAFVSGALFSQAQIMQLMKNEFARSRRHSIPLGCLLLQVDRLAQLVDLYGAGLRQAVRGAIAEMVRDRTRGPDLLGATSDERYLLVLPHTDVSQTRIVAERLRQRFTELEIAVDGRELALTISIGVAASVAGETLFFDTLVSQAEAAVDYAGRRGGDQVVSFGETQLREELAGDRSARRDLGEAGAAPGDAGETGETGEAGEGPEPPARRASDRPEDER
ncbi:MAG: GGDEF domain-containing protein [bacterium]|nr:GGDEF domain-containing protein [bacterium]